VGDPFSLLPTAIAYAIVARQDGITVTQSALIGVKAAQKLAYADANTTNTKRWGTIVRGSPLTDVSDTDRALLRSEKGYKDVDEYDRLTWSMNRIEEVYDEDMARAFYLRYVGWPMSEIAETIQRSESTVRHWFRVLIPRLFSPLELT
jgi:hypothetical protein